MKDILLDIASHFRAQQLFNHLAHNLSKNPTFFADHEAFLGFYEAAESAYDSVVERFIGLYGPKEFNHKHVLLNAYTTLAQLPDSVDENKEFFIVSLTMEEEVVKLLEQACKNPDCSEGTRQMLGNLADLCEQRMYFIKQRLR